MAQIDFGEYNSEKGRGSGGGQGHNCVLAALDKFYPYRYRDALTPEGLKYVNFVKIYSQGFYRSVHIYFMKDSFNKSL